MKLLRAVEVIFLAALIFVAIEAGLTLHRMQGALPGMVAIGLYMLVLGAVVSFGVVSGHLPRLLLILVPFGPRLGWQRGDLRAAAKTLAPAFGIAVVAVLAILTLTSPHTLTGAAMFGFAAWLIVDWVVGPIVHSSPGHFFPIDSLLQAIILVVSIFMMVKASHNEAYVLPIIGELAQKSATEQ